MSVIGSGRIVQRRRGGGRAPFWRRALQRVERLRETRNTRFWEERVKPEAVALLQGDPRSAQLFTHPDLSMAFVRSAERVRFLRLQTGETYVVRAARATGGLFRRSDDLERFADSIRGTIHLARLGFPVARVIGTREGVELLGLRRYVFAIEEFLPARPLNAASQAPCDAMRLLARLHAHTFETWGRIFDQRPRAAAGYVAWLRQDVLTQLRRVERLRRLGLGTADVDRLWRLYEKEATSLVAAGPGAFRLVHGDVSPRNFLADSEGRIRIVDFMTMHADLAGGEIVKGTMSLTRGATRFRPDAWRAYFEVAGSERWEEFRRQARLAFAHYALRELSHDRTGDAVGAEHGRPTREGVIAWIRQLFEVPAAIWGHRPGETDWPRVAAILGWGGEARTANGAIPRDEKIRRSPGDTDGADVCRS